MGDYLMRFTKYVFILFSPPTLSQINLGNMQWRGTQDKMTVTVLATLDASENQHYMDQWQKSSDCYRIHESILNIKRKLETS